jgi:hypothetical protein
MKNKNRNERLNKISDALFGAPEELSNADAAEDLEVTGVDREELCARMYERLCAEAKEYRLDGKQVPPLLRKALEDLRKRAGPPRTSEEMNNRADSKISKLLEAVRVPLSQATVGRGLAFSVSYRNKTDQPATDQQIIERLEKRLTKEMEEEKDNRD